MNMMNENQEEFDGSNSEQQQQTGALSSLLTSMSTSANRTPIYWHFNSTAPSPVTTSHVAASARTDGFAILPVSPHALTGPSVGVSAVLDSDIDDSASKPPASEASAALLSPVPSLRYSVGSAAKEDSADSSGPSTMLCCDDPQTINQCLCTCTCSQDELSSSHGSSSSSVDDASASVSTSPEAKTCQAKHRRTSPPQHPSQKSSAESAHIRPCSFLQPGVVFTGYQSFTTYASASHPSSPSAVPGGVSSVSISVAQQAAYRTQRQQPNSNSSSSQYPFLALPRVVPSWADIQGSAIDPRIQALLSTSLDHAYTAGDSIAKASTKEEWEVQVRYSAVSSITSGIN